MRVLAVVVLMFGAMPSASAVEIGEANTPASSEREIVDGNAVTTCGWPTTVLTGGCTGTLIHPKAISTAQHCGQPSQVRFSESTTGGQTVAVLGCVGTGSQDAMICELAERVDDLPVTPPLFGCELDEYLNVGQPVVMVGFGQTSFGSGGGTKLWANQTIAAVEPGRVIVGEGGVGPSPCPGDSGGPVFVQVADGSWRTIGTVLGGTTGVPCNSAADFQRIDPVVANFESARGLDITPCFDAATGQWEPGPECTGFFSGDHNGSGTWADWCTGTPAAGNSATCGPAYSDPNGADAGPGSTADAGSGSSDSDGGNGGSADGDEEGGCGCRTGGDAPGAVLLIGLAFALTVRRRQP